MALFSSVSLSIPLVLLGISWMTDLLLMVNIAIRTRQLPLLLFFPLWEVYYLINNLLFAPWSMSSPDFWGNRD